MPLTIYIVSDRNSSIGDSSAAAVPRQWANCIRWEWQGTRKCSKKEIWSLDLSYLWHRLYPSHLLIQLLSCRCAVLGSWRVPVRVEVLVSAGENPYQDRWKLILWNYIYHPWVTEEVGTSLPCKQSHLKRETRHLNLVKISQNCENQQFRIPPKIRNSRLWEIRVIVQASILLLGRGGEPVLLYTDCRK